MRNTVIRHSAKNKCIFHFWWKLECSLVKVRALKLGNTRFSNQHTK